MADSLLCYQHAPGVAEERHRSHVKGGKTGGRGRTKGGSELVWIKQQLKETTVGVLAGEIPKDKGAVVAQLLNAYKGVIEVERKIHETEVLEERLTGLERVAEQQARRGRRFG